MSVYLTVSVDGMTGGYQLSIGDDDSGFRIAGPKFNGSGREVLRRELSAYDVKSIAAYLDKVPA